MTDQYVKNSYNLKKKIVQEDHKSRKQLLWKNLK